MTTIAGKHGDGRGADTTGAPCPAVRQREIDEAERRIAELYPAETTPVFPGWGTRKKGKRP